MPKAIVLGVLGLVAICAIAAGGRRSDSPPQSEVLVVFAAPASAASTKKSDRLETLVVKDLDLPKQITEVSFIAAEQEPLPAPPINRPSPTPDFIPRHWRDPYAPKPEAQKHAGVAKKRVKRAAEEVQASLAKECPNDRFAPLLRKLGLAAACNT
jgi:hypothetical protein